MKIPVLYFETITPYDHVDPSGMFGEYTIQNIGGTTYRLGLI